MSTATASLALVQPSNNAIALPGTLASFPILDIYAPNGVTYSDNRVDAFATISAGAKDSNGKFPTRSKDGKIILHDPEGRAPGLKEALAAYEYRALDIAFPTDDLSAIFQQRFTEYSASNLLAYGDEREIVQLGMDQKTKQPVRRILKAGTPEYEQVRARCKVSTSVYFHLAEWTKDGPQVVFPDGLGYYRLRFTSRNSARRIIAALQMTAKYFGGRIAGVPFQLSLENAEVAGPDGSRRKVPVWNCRFVPPTTFSLSSQNFRNVAEKALAQGAQLMLPPPQSESLEVAVSEGEDLDLDEAAVSMIQAGGACDAAHYRKAYFAAVKDSPLATDEGRAAFIKRYTASTYWVQTDSLSDALSQMTDERAQTFLLDVRDELDIIWADAVAAYDALLAQAEGLGIKRRELPTDAYFSKVESYSQSLRAAIARRLNSPETAQSVEAPPTNGVEATPNKKDKSAGLAAVVRATREAASQVTPEVQQEIDSVFGDPPVQEADIVADADELGDSPEHVTGFMDFLFKSHGVDHGGDFAHGPTLTAINNWRSERTLPLIASVADISEREMDDLFGAFNRKEIQVGLL